MKAKFGKPFSSRNLFVPWLSPVLFAGLLLTAVFSAHAAKADTAYASWIKPWAERPVASPAFGGAKLKMIITTVKGEADYSTIASLSPLERLNLSYRIKISATELTTDGMCRSYFVSNTSAKGTANHQLTAVDFERLSQWLEYLPDDESVLPPAGSRVVVQTIADDHWQVRVFDRNKLPLEVKALFDLLPNPCDRFL